MLAQVFDKSKPFGAGGEFSLISALRKRLTSNLSDEIVGQLDDGVVIPTKFIGKFLVASVDSFVEGRHFRREFGTPEDLGFKALATAFSDLAAMLAAPRYALINLHCGAAENRDFLERIYDGVNQFCQEFGVQVVGGNISSASELSLSITAMGGAEREPTLRSSLKPGEDLWITAPLGLSDYVLRSLLRGSGVPQGCDASRYFRPTPRFGLSSHSEVVSSCIDISDGVFQDASHLIAASGLGIQLFLDALVHPEVPEEEQIRSLFGGGDYELLFTAPPTARERLMQAGYRRCGAVHGNDLRVLRSSGEWCSPEELAASVGVTALGSNHFCGISAA